jgi:DNA repair protein RAD16
MGELYSTVRFLRIDPFAFYFCKVHYVSLILSSCQLLVTVALYRFTKGLCDDCDHSAMQHFCHFNKHVLHPIKRAYYVGKGRHAMLNLKDEVLDKILLRRINATRSDDIQLPPR